LKVKSRPSKTPPENIVTSGRRTLLALAVLVLGLVLVLAQLKPIEKTLSGLLSRVPQQESVPSGSIATLAEDRMIEVQRHFITYLQTETGLSRQEKTRALRQMLRAVQETLAETDDATLNNHLYAFKYPVRRMAEELAQLDPDALSKDLEEGFTAQNRLNPEKHDTPWAFDRFEEASYQTIFHDPEYIQPAWAMKVLLAERFQDRQSFLQLAAQDASASPNDLSKTDVIRQLFTGYASSRRGEEQVANALKVLDPTRLRGATWAEIGYGTGKSFQAVRRVIGPKGRLIGVEVGPGYTQFANRLLLRHPQEWGEITLIEGNYTDCRLPPNSVDIVHEAGIHVGEHFQEHPDDPQLQWLLSIKRALRPGGLMVLNDHGSPPWTRPGR
jgi:hypothetical protein